MVCPLRRWRWFDRLLGRMEPVWEPDAPLNPDLNKALKSVDWHPAEPKKAKKRTKKARKKK